MNKVSWIVFATLVSLSARASASTDINGLFDARSAGMGGTGVAYLDSAGAIPTNPALLDQIGKLTLTVDTMLIVAQPEAPYTVYHLDAAGQPYANYETIRSSPAAAPLPFIGGAYRLTDRVVLGLAAYPVIGQGTDATYRPAPDQFPQLVAHNKAAMGLVEIADAVSVKVTDTLSIAGMWRINYMTQSISSPLSTGAPPAGVAFNTDHTQSINANIHTSGFNFLGLQLGVLWRPVPNLRLGLTYRNKVVAQGTGTTTTTVGGRETVLATRSSFTNPHAFRAGLAWSGLKDRLLLAADFKYLMYAEAYKNTPAIITTKNGMDSVQVRPAHWKDSVAVLLGAEFKATEALRLRAGYIWLNSATNPAYAQQLMAPPGNSNLVSAGLGVRVADSLNIDVAAAYVALQSRVTTATPYNAGVGTYASHGAEFSLSATYHN